MKNKVTDLIGIIERQGYVDIDKGSLFYNVTLINNHNFSNITEEFKKQLIEEGLYNNAYISHIGESKEPPFSIKTLPIYGDNRKYVTKWFKHSRTKVIDADLRDKHLDLINRIV